MMEATPNSFDWSTFNNSIAIGFKDGTIRILNDTLDGVWRMPRAHRDSSIVCLKWSPTQNVLASVDRAYNVWFWFFDQNLLLLKRKDLIHKCWYLEWSPCGTFVAFFGFNNTITIYNFSELTVVAEWETCHNVRSLAWSDDSSKIVAGNADELHVWTRAGDHLRNLNAHEHKVMMSSVRWIADTIKFACYHGALVTWFPDDTIHVTQLQCEQPMITGLAKYSPDGTRVAFSYVNDILYIVDACNGARLVAVEPPFQQCYFRREFAWSPDSSKIVMFNKNKISFA